MKGIVFTELLEMVEQKHGYDFVDQLIENAGVESDGAYTAVGTYSFDELAQLTKTYCKLANTTSSAMLVAFGHHLFGVFIRNYPAFFENCTDAFQLLESIEHTIHVEVLKLYPDAELPRFVTSRSDEKILVMDYYSERRMSALALGLIEATLNHYGVTGVIQTARLDDEEKAVRFQITRTV